MSTINDIGIPGIGGGILHPKLKNKWRVRFTGIGDGPTGQALSLQATTVERPKLSHEEVELHRYNSKIWIAGKHTFEPITLTVEDDITGQASSVIQQQLQKQQFLVGAEGQYLASAATGSLYKFGTYLDLLDGGSEVVEEWQLSGSWIQNIDYGDLDYSSSEAVLLTLTIRYDHAQQVNVASYSGPGAAIGGATI
jgi:hypothetical protein